MAINSIRCANLSLLLVTLLVNSALTATVREGNKSTNNNNSSSFTLKNKDVDRVKENNEIGTKYSDSFYRTAHGFMIRSKPFSNFTLEDSINWINDIEAYNPPEEFSHRFPYYMSGFDYEDRPVWIMEIGKFNTRWVVEQGAEAMEAFEKYMAKMCLRVLRSMEAQREKGKDVRDILFIGDWEGLNYNQVAHVPTAIFVLNIFRKYAEILTNALNQAVAINVSYPVEAAFNIGRPYLGGLFLKSVIYGNNKSKWVAALRRMLPEESIPTWYGGREDFKPVQLFG